MRRVKSKKRRDAGVSKKSPVTIQRRASPETLDLIAFHLGYQSRVNWIVLKIRPVAWGGGNGPIPPTGKSNPYRRYAIYDFWGPIALSLLL